MHLKMHVKDYLLILVVISIITVSSIDVSFAQTTPSFSNWQFIDTRTISVEPSVPLANPSFRSTHITDSNGNLLPSVIDYDPVPGAVITFNAGSDLSSGIAVDSRSYTVSWPDLSPVDSSLPSLPAGEIVVTSDRTPPKLLSAMFVDIRTIELRFNEDVMLPESNGFGIQNDELGGITTVRHGDSDEIIRLTTASDAVDTESYVLTYPAIDDLNGPSSALSAGSSTLTYDTVSPTIVSAQFTSPTRIVFTFSEPVAILSMALITSYFSISDLGGIVSAATSDSTITLTTARSAVAGVSYEITHQGINDLHGPSAALSAGNSTLTYDTVSPVLTSASFTDTRTIKLTFNEDVMLPESSVFVLDPSLGTITPTQGDDSNDIITLTTASDAVAGESYVLTYPDINDMNGPSAALAGSSHFLVYRLSVMPITPSAMFTSPAIIEITIDEGIAQASIPHIKDHLAINPVLTGTGTPSVTLGTPTIITFTADSPIDDGRYTITLPNLADPTLTTTIFPFTIIITRDTTKPELTSTSFIEDDKIALTFSEGVILPPSSEFEIEPDELGGISARHGDSDNIIILSTDFGSADGDSYDITYPDIDDLHEPPNTLDGDTVNVTYNFKAPPVIIASAILSDNVTISIRLDFSENIEHIDSTFRTEPPLNITATIYFPGSGRFVSPYLLIEFDTELTEQDYVLFVPALTSLSSPQRTLPAQQITLSYDTTPPEIVSALFTDPKTIAVIFNENIDFLATNTFTSVNNELGAITTVRGNPHNILILTTELEATDGELYILTIANQNVNDQSSFSSHLVADMLEVTYDAMPFDAPTAKFTGTTTIEIVISEEINEQSISNISDNTVITPIFDSMNPIVSIAFGTPTIITLDVRTPGTDNQEYVIQLPMLTDTTTPPITRFVPEIRITYYDPPVLTNANFVANRLTGLQEIRITTNENIQNIGSSTFTINEGLRITEQSFNTEDKLITLELNREPRANTEYTVTYSNVIDHSPAPIPISGMFRLTHDTSPPEIISASFTGTKTIELRFDELVMLPESNEFEIEPGLGTITATYGASNDIIILTAANDGINRTYVITYPDIVDMNNQFSAALSGSTHRIEFDDTPPILRNARFTSSTTIAFKFNDDITIPSTGFGVTPDTLGSIEAAHGESNNILILTTELEATDGDSYVITYPDIEDTAGPSAPLAGSTRNLFYDSATESLPLEIVYARFEEQQGEGGGSSINSSRIGIKFDADVALNSNTAHSSYDLDEFESDLGIRTVNILKVSPSKVTIDNITNGVNGRSYEVSYPSIAYSDSSLGRIPANTIIVEYDLRSFEFSNPRFTGPNEILIDVSESYAPVSAISSNDIPSDLFSIPQNLLGTITTEYDPDNNWFRLATGAQANSGPNNEGTDYYIDHNPLTNGYSPPFRLAETNPGNGVATPIPVRYDNQSPTVNFGRFVDANSFVIVFANEESIVLPSPEDFDISPPRGEITVSYDEDIPTRILLTTTVPFVSGVEYTISYSNIDDGGSPSAPISGMIMETYADDTDPILSNPRFTGSTEILIDVSEEIADIDMNSFGLTYMSNAQLTPITANYDQAKNIIVLNTGSPAVVDRPYKITHPAINDKLVSPNILASGELNVKYDIMPPELVSVVFITSNSIIFTFNEPINTGFLSNTFKIEPSLGNNTTIPVPGNANVIELATTNSAVVGTQYTITYPDIHDMGTPSAPLPGSSVMVTYNADASFEITDTSFGPDGDVIVITFSDDIIDPQSRSSEFMINGGAIGFDNIVFGVANNDTILLQLTNTTPEGTSYTVTYPDIVPANSLLPTITGGTLDIKFDTIPPVISNQRFTSLTTIVIDSNEELDATEIDGSDIFIISPSLGSVQSVFDSTSNQITLTTDNEATVDKTYTVIHPDINDTGSPSAPIDEGKFMIRYDITPFEILLAGALVELDTIIIKFSMNINTDGLTSTNFSINQDTAIGSIHNIRDDSIGLVLNKDIIYDVQYELNLPVINAEDPLIPPLAASTYRFTFDDVSPVLSAPTFTGPNSILITVSEDIRDPKYNTFTIDPPLGNIQVFYDDVDDYILLVTEDSASDTVGYTINHPIIRDLRDPSGPLASADLPEITYDASMPGITMAQFSGPTEIRIELNAEILAISSLVSVISTTPDQTILTTSNVISADSDRTIVFTTTEAEPNTSYKVTYRFTVSSPTPSTLPSHFGILLVRYDTESPTLTDAVFVDNQTITISVSENIVPPSMDAFTTTSALGTLTASYDARTDLITLRTTGMATTGDYEINYPAITDLGTPSRNQGASTITATYDSGLPVISSASFSGPGAILIEFERPIDASSLGTFTSMPDTLGTLTPTYDSSTFTITLLTSELAVANQGYTVTLPDIVNIDSTSTLSGAMVNVTYDTLPIVLSNARFSDSNTIVIDVNKALPTQDFRNLFDIQPEVGLNRRIAPHFNTNDNTIVFSVSNYAGSSFTPAEGAIFNIALTGQLVDSAIPPNMLSSYSASFRYDTSPLTIIDLSFVSSNRIAISFDNPIDDSSLGEFTIAPSLGNIIPAYDAHNQTLFLDTMDSATDGEMYNISWTAINPMNRLLGSLDISSRATTYDDTVPELTDPKFTSQNTITIMVTELINDPSGTDNFSINPYLGQVIATYDDGTNLITLTTAVPVTVDNTMYTITHPTIDDLHGPSATLARAELADDAIYMNEAPKLTNARFTGDNTITIDVNKDIVPPNPTSFSNTEGLGNITAAYDPDTDLITLTTTGEATHDTQYTITHPAIVDTVTPPGTLSSSTTPTAPFNGTTPTLSAVFIDGRTIRITPSEPIVPPDTDAFTLDPPTLGDIFSSEYTPGDPTDPDDHGFITLTTVYHSNDNAEHTIMHPDIVDMGSSPVRTLDSGTITVQYGFITISDVIPRHIILRPSVDSITLNIDMNRENGRIRIPSNITVVAPNIMVTLNADISTSNIHFRTDDPAFRTILINPIDAIGEISTDFVAADGDNEDRNTEIIESFESPHTLLALEIGSDTHRVFISDSSGQSLFVPIRLIGASSADHIYYIDRNDDQEFEVHSINKCASATMATAMAPPSVGTLPDECYVVDGSDIVIWTNHFTIFGAIGPFVATGEEGGDECSDCTPPTLGVDDTGVRRVTGGFTYNNDTVNVEYYYTPLPLIKVDVGEENIAILKIFEDSGTTRLRHAGLAFGLSSTQHFSQSEAIINVDISFTGKVTVSLYDPQNTIDNETLRADTAVEKCMTSSESECAVVTIYHTFRNNLDFDIVSTIVWDERLNSWQNFYNHGIEIIGESLNPSHGILVNDGTLKLYPLIAEFIDEDNDGVYDYDARHVIYMFDDERTLHKLTPDGMYQPVSNLSSLYHEIDYSMYEKSGINTDSLDRTLPTFDQELLVQQEIALQILLDMGVKPTPELVSTFTPSLYDNHTEVPRMDLLDDTIDTEIDIAKQLLENSYPSLYTR